MRLILVMALAALGAPPSFSAGPPPAATVNGHRLEVWEADREYSNLVSAAMYHRGIRPERRAELRRQTLDTLILKQLKLQWAVSNAVVVDPSAVHEAWKDVRGRFADQGAYSEALANAGITEEDLRAAIRRDVAADAVDRHVAALGPPPTEHDVVDFFCDHRHEYVVPEARHVLASLVHVPASASAPDWREAERRARDLAEAVSAGSTSLLAEAERVRSTLPPAARGEVGDLGFVHRGALQPEADTEVFASTVGDTVGPIRTLYGFLVIQAVAVRPERSLPLHEVRESITRRMVRERRAAALQDLENALIQTASIEEGHWVGAR